jgi:flagellar motor switch protein FliG
LRQWDALPADKQKTFLENEHVVGVYLELQETAPQERGKVLAALPGDIRFPLEQRLQKWNSMPAAQRQELSDRFTLLFQSEETAREKIIAGLPEDVRQPVQKLTQQLKQLPPEQRQKCTLALNKFLKMAPDEQRQFLQNATRWQKMSEKEHNAWRQVVTKVPQLPPMPPGMDPPAPLMAGTNSVVPVNAP